MAFQTDVLASIPLVAGASAVFQTQAATTIGPCRIKAVFGVSAGTAGTVVIRDGAVGSNIVLTVNTPAAVGTFHILLPGEGILCRTGPFGVITTTTNATIIYG